MGIADHNTLTGNALHLTKVEVRSGAPVSPPPWLGYVAFDFTGNVLYVSKGVSSLSDWVPITFSNTIDNQFFILNAADNSRRFRFSAANIPVNTAIVLSTQPQSYTLAGIDISQVFSQDQSFAANVILRNNNALVLNTTDNSRSVSLRYKSSASANASYSLPILPTGNGQILSSDATGSMSWVLNNGGVFQANDADTIFTSSSSPRQLGCTPSAPRNYTLDGTGIVAGQVIEFFNNSTVVNNYITLKSGDGSNIDQIIPTQKLSLVARVNNPTLPTDWKVIEAYSGWVSYIPIIQGFAGVVDVEFFFKRDRSNIRIRGLFRVGVPSPNAANFSLPTYLNFSSRTQNLLRGYSSCDRTPYLWNLVLNTQLNRVSFGSPTNPVVPAAADTIFNTGNFCQVVDFSDTIAGWN